MSYSEQITTIVFDWGDTLMVNDPAQRGPMVDWPQVSAVAGAQAALVRLKSNYHLILASNAQDSNKNQIRAALGRAGLDEFIDEIFTMHELGEVKKPALGFFQGINAALDCQPWQTLMVGDDYASDVAGATAAGWKAIWLNPQRRPAPLLAPLYSAEIAAMAELPEVIDSHWLPAPETCRSWYIGQNASPNLMIHVSMVAALAYQMAYWLRQAGQALDPLLTHRAGLLHDVCKISAHDGPIRHPEAGARLLEGNGLPVLAEIVRRHGLYSLLDKAGAPQTWEQKLVYYADKLIEGNQVVPIEVRLTRIRDRYGLDPQTIERITVLVRQLETEICAPLGLTGDALNERLGKAFLNGFYQE